VKHQKVKFWPLKTKFKASPKKKGGGGEGQVWREERKGEKRKCVGEFIS
jgi:hypothetical protein